MVARTKARYEAIHALKTDGKGIKAIRRELGLAKETVRRFYRATNVEELLAKPRTGRPSVLDAYKPYLHQRWNAGITNASTLYREITEQGYRGSQGTVAVYLAPLRELSAAPPPKPAVPKVRQITSWMLRHPEDLDTDQALQLKQVLVACPHLDATATHVASFAEILTGRHGDRLDSWMAAVDAADLSHLHRFVTGLRRDYQAVRNGLTLAHSSGSVEGNVNRIKMIKRQMYGRANFDLLRNASCSPPDQQGQLDHGKWARSSFQVPSTRWGTGTLHGTEKSVVRRLRYAYCIPPVASVAGCEAPLRRGLCFLTRSLAW